MHDCEMLHNSIADMSVPDGELLHTLEAFVERFFDKTGALIMPSTDDIKKLTTLYKLLRESRPAVATELRAKFISRLTWREKIRLGTALV